MSGFFLEDNTSSSAEPNDSDRFAQYSSETQTPNQVSGYAGGPTQNASVAGQFNVLQSRSNPCPGHAMQSMQSYGNSGHPQMSWNTSLNAQSSQAPALVMNNAQSGQPFGNVMAPHAPATQHLLVPTRRSLLSHVVPSIEQSPPSYSQTAEHQRTSFPSERLPDRNVPITPMYQATSIPVRTSESLSVHQSPWPSEINSQVQRSRREAVSVGGSTNNRSVTATEQGEFPWSVTGVEPIRDARSTGTEPRQTNRQQDYSAADVESLAVDFSAPCGPRWCPTDPRDLLGPAKEEEDIWTGFLRTCREGPYTAEERKTLNWYCRYCGIMKYDRQCILHDNGTAVCATCRGTVSPKAKTRPSQNPKRGDQSEGGRAGKENDGAA